MLRQCSRRLCAGSTVERSRVQLPRLAVSAVGSPGTREWRAYLKTESPELRDSRTVSPWHDVPFTIANPKRDNLLVFVNEIERGSRAKLEMSKEEPHNPIAQDVFKKKPGTPLRYFTYGDLPFNYGFIPRTWENPTVRDTQTGCLGDGDPIDVVELSAEPCPVGTVAEVRVLGLLGLIDEGETDWKLITCRTNSTSTTYRNLSEVPAPLLAVVHDWFLNYKTTDGKPKNELAFDGKFRGVDDAMNTAIECQHFYQQLVSGVVANPGLWLR